MFFDLDWFYEFYVIFVPSIYKLHFYNLNEQYSWHEIDPTPEEYYILHAHQF